MKGIRNFNNEKRNVFYTNSVFFISNENKSCANNKSVGLNLGLYVGGPKEEDLSEAQFTEKGYPP